jgi:hypothetical protein
MWESPSFPTSLTPPPSTPHLIPKKKLTEHVYDRLDPLRRGGGEAPKKIYTQTSLVKKAYRKISFTKSLPLAPFAPGVNETLDGE